MKIKEENDMNAYLKGKRKKLYKTIKDVIEENNKRAPQISCFAR